MTEPLAADLCVVIPALNEAKVLPLLLRDLSAQKGLRVDAVVVDGGSTDATVTVARAGGARIVQSARGRACQMNAGARVASTGFLLFLHADSRLDSPRLLADALGFLRDVLRKQGHDRVAGHFALQFQCRRDRNRLAWRYIEAKTALNRPGTTNGDQGLLLSRRYFDELNGFDESQSLLEDQRICARIREKGALLTLPGKLQTSGRRFERNGFHRQYLLMMLIMTMHALGRREFFEQSANLYDAHHERAGMRALPFFLLAMRLLRASGWRSYCQGWHRIGRYGGENLWQLFFFFDVVLAREDAHRLLRFFDRRIAPLTHNPVSRLVAALVLWLHVHLIVLPWLWWQDLRH